MFTLKSVNIFVYNCHVQNSNFIKFIQHLSERLVHGCSRNFEKVREGWQLLLLARKFNLN